jgi:hypothetical protein
MLCNLSFSINSGRSYARILELSGTEISSCIFLVNIGYSFRYPNFKLPNRKPERRGLLPISGRRRASPAAPFPAPRSPLLSWSGGLRARPSSPRPICNSASTSAPGSRRQHPRGTSPFRPPFRLSVRLHLRPRHASPPPPLGLPLRPQVWIRTLLLLVMKIENAKRLAGRRSLNAIKLPAPPSLLAGEASIVAGRRS